MTATASTTRRQDRRRHQQRVTGLLEQLQEGRRRVYLLQAAGTRPAGLRDLKTELKRLHRDLAALTRAPKQM